MPVWSVGEVQALVVERRSKGGLDISRDDGHVLGRRTRANNLGLSTAKLDSPLSSLPSPLPEGTLKLRKVQAVMRQSAISEVVAAHALDRSLDTSSDGARAPDLCTRADIHGRSRSMRGPRASFLPTPPPPPPQTQMKTKTPHPQQQQQKKKKKENEKEKTGEEDSWGISHGVAPGRGLHIHGGNHDLSTASRKEEGVADATLLLPHR